MAVGKRVSASSSSLPFSRPSPLLALCASLLVVLPGGCQAGAAETGEQVLGRVAEMEHELEQGFESSASTPSSSSAAAHPVAATAGLRPGEAGHVAVAAAPPASGAPAVTSPMLRGPAPSDPPVSAPPPSGATAHALASSASSPPAKPWVKHPRPPFDPRTVVGSKAYFPAVAEMQRLGHPVETNSSSSILNQTTLEHNLTRDSLALVHLTGIFSDCAPNVSTCPDFTSCNDQHLAQPHAVCRSAAFHTLPESHPSPRDFCSQAPAPANGACLREADGWWADKVPITFFRLHDVSVTDRGLPMDEQHLMVRGGCLRDDPSMSYTANVTEVLRVDQAVTVFYTHAINFYHAFVEAMPYFIAIAPFLQAQPRTPILMSCTQWLSYIELGLPVVGIPLHELNVVCIETRRLIHARELIQPMFGSCGSPGVELLFDLRRRFYLPEDGLPFFTPGWVLRGQHPLTLSEMHRVPPDWVVVMGRRGGTDRSLNIEGELWEALRKEFGGERTVLFNGSMHILQAKELFNRAVLYVGVHGAGLSNLVFMPMNNCVGIQAKGVPQRMLRALV